MKVNLLFRKINPLYFSIEKVFESIIPFFPKDISVSKTYVRSERANIQSIIKNLSYKTKEKADVHHVTGDVHYMAMAFAYRKTVLTIHDCVFMTNTSGVKRSIMKWLWLKLPVKASKIVTVISEATKADVIKYTGCSPKKVVVVPDPIGTKFTASLKEFNSTLPRVLHVGTWPNKNLERVIAAVTGLNIQLVIIGKPDDRYLKMLQDANINFEHCYKISEEELVEQYRRSDVLIFPSTFEGFGLPIIEAQATGRVVVTSNLLPMSQVAGGAAILVDPMDVDSIRNGLREAIDNTKLREALIEKGLQNVKQYSAENIAAQYYNLYKQLTALN